MDLDGEIFLFQKNLFLLQNLRHSKTLLPSLQPSFSPLKTLFRSFCPNQPTTSTDRQSQRLYHHQPFLLLPNKKHKKKKHKKVNLYWLSLQDPVININSKANASQLLPLFLCRVNLFLFHCIHPGTTAVFPTTSQRILSLHLHLLYQHPPPGFLYVYFPLVRLYPLY